MNKEATPSEVFTHINLADVGRSLKNWLVLAVFYLVVVGCTEVMGRALPASPAPWSPGSFMLWAVIIWAFVYTLLAERSYHVIDASYYFPQLGWLGSLFFAVFLVGFTFLGHIIFQETGRIAFLIVVLIAWPFIGLFNLMQIGHSRLMQARAAEGVEILHRQ